MLLRSIFGTVLLGVATSCVPMAEPARTAAAPKPIRNPRLLLAKLGLTVPDGPLAEPASLAATPIGASITAAPAFVDLGSAPDDAARARDCLTAAVYYEARSEAPDGQRAVAQVVLNRVRNRAFPNTVCGVVYQGSNRRTGCQFSFTCDGSLYRPREPGAWDRAREIADAALAGGVFAAVGSATSYHTTAILPWWAPSLTQVTTIGAHIFYRWRSTLENALAFGQRYAGVEPVIGGVPAVAGAREAVASTFGVRVHYGSTPSDQGEEDHGVTIHRGGTRIIEAATPVEIRAPAMAHGVRIHVGTHDAPPEMAETAI